MNPPFPRYLAIGLCVASVAVSPGERVSAAEPPAETSPTPLVLDLAQVFPAPGATRLPPDAPLRLAFSAAPTIAAAGKIEIHDAASGVVVATVDVATRTATKSIGGSSYQYYPVIVSGRDVVITAPPGALDYGRSYYVTIAAGVFNVDGRGSAALDDPARWRFTTKPSAPAAGAQRLVIAADGRGDFCTVQGAIDFVPAENVQPVTLELQRGDYIEMVNVPRGKAHVTLRGADRRQSVIRYANNARFNPRMRALLDVTADDFRLENLTLRNTTPRGGSQSETIRLRADRGVLDHCDCSSLQDTLQLTGRVYVNECFVEGDVDFVWGSGTVYFNRCELKALNPGYLVQSRNGAERLGYVFVDCRLTAAPGVTRYILARIEPGRFPYSHVAFINCAMGPHISPVGWQFDKVPGGAAVGPVEHEQFQEFQSVTLDGTPVDVSQRLAPSRQLTAEEAAKLREVKRVLGGKDDWDPTKR